MALLDQNWGFGGTADEEENSEVSSNRPLTSRDGTLMLIEYSPEMFENLLEQIGEAENGFQLVMNVCQRFYRSKIISNDKDLSGIVLFGTENSRNAFDFKNIFILQDLAQPSAERIVQLENVSNKKNAENLFGSKFSKNFSLNEALWICSNLFANSAQRLTIKRIFIFTSNDRPHANNLTFEKQAKQRAKDLNDVGIQVELFPILTETKTKFDYKLFFQDVLMLDDDQTEYKQSQTPTTQIDELCKLVYSKEHKKRAYCSIPLCLGTSSNGTAIQISVSVFNLVRPCPKPTKIKLDMKTNMETKLVTKHYLPTTAEILMPSDIQYGIDVANRRVLFDGDELKLMKKFSDPGFEVLGFKSLSCLSAKHYVKSGHFIYPDEKFIEGSSLVFNSLLKKCLEREMFILCQLTTRRNSSARLVALIPQEKKNSANGFHVHYLPYSDDIRNLPKNDVPRAKNEDVDRFKSLIRGLKFKYRPEQFENPALQTLWRNIEATALNKDQPEEFIDLTLPNLEQQRNKVGKFIDEIKSTIFPEDYVMGATKRATKKRKTETNGADSTNPKKVKTEIDVETAARSKTLNKLTIPILKQFCKENNLKTSGSKKQDLINTIVDHLGVESQ